MAYRGQGRDCRFVWYPCYQSAYIGNWTVQAAGAVGTFGTGYQIPWEVESFTPRHDYGKRRTTALSPVGWHTIGKRAAPFESHGFDVTGPVTPMSILYPMMFFCNRQGMTALGTVNNGDKVYSWVGQPQAGRGSTVSSYTWPAALGGRILYDVGTSDAFDPALPESIELRFDEDGELSITVSCFAATCYEGTVLNCADGTNIDVEPACAFKAANGTVRYNGTVTAVKNGVIRLSRTLTPHRGLGSGTLAGAVSYGDVSGSGDFTFYLETQSDWDAIEHDCRLTTCGTLTFDYTGSTSLNGTAGNDEKIKGTVFIDPLRVVKPAAAGELMRTLEWEMAGPDHDSSPTVPFDFEGTFHLPYTTSLGVPW